MPEEQGKRSQQTRDLEHLAMLYPEIVDEAMRSQDPVTEVREYGKNATIYRAVYYDHENETAWRADIDADEHPDYHNEPTVSFAKCHPTATKDFIQEWSAVATGRLTGPQKLPEWEAMAAVFEAALELYRREGSA